MKLYVILTAETNTGEHRYAKFSKPELFLRKHEAVLRFESMLFSEIDLRRDLPEESRRYDLCSRYHAIFGEPNKTIDLIRIDVPDNSEEFWLTTEIETEDYSYDYYFWYPTVFKSAEDAKHCIEDHFKKLYDEYWLLQDYFKRVEKEGYYCDPDFTGCSDDEAHICLERNSWYAIRFKIPEDFIDIKNLNIDDSELELFETRDLETCTKYTETVFKKFNEHNEFDVYQQIDLFMQSFAHYIDFYELNWYILQHNTEPAYGSIDLSQCKVGDKCDDEIHKWMADVYVYMLWFTDITPYEISKKCPAKELAAQYPELRGMSLQNTCLELLHKYWGL